MIKPLIALLLFHILLFAVIILNIPILRQIIAFIYLSFIPGVALLKLLKLNGTMVVEKILLIVGLSLAFLMFSGLLINELLLVLHISMPLTSTLLLISLSFLTLVLSVVAYRKDLTADLKLSDSFLNLKNLAPKSVLIIPLILGVVGSLYTNVYVLSLMIISIAILFGLSVFSNKFSSAMSIPVILFFVSLTLTFQVLLTSKYIMGWDANVEYYVFKSTANSGHWALLSTYTSLSSMLSISILPTIYYSLMNCSGEVVFKSLYPFIFSLVPVALFSTYSKQLGKTTSVLSALFFVSGSLVFYGVEQLSLDREIVGTLFLVLSFLVILNKSLPVGKRRFLLIVFGSALIVSHYSLTLIYLFLILFLCIISKVRKYQDNILNFGLVSLLFAVAFLWYSYVGSILIQIGESLNSIFSSFISDFGSATSRIGWIAGSHPAYGSNINFAGDINWTFLILANLFVAIGAVGLIARSLRKTKKWSTDPQFRIICILSGFILLLCLAIPNLGPSLNFTRFYAITFLFLSPCFVIGGELVVDIAGALWKRSTAKCFSVNVKKATKILLYIVLIGYFLSQSGFINIITGAVPLSFSLDYARVSTSLDKNVQMNFGAIYIPEQDVFSASWLLNYKVETAEVFADQISGVHVLASYGLIQSNLILSITSATIPSQGSFVYLSSLNIVHGVIATSTGSLNTTEISPLLNQSDLIYTNGNSEIWFVAPIP